MPAKNSVKTYIENGYYHVYNRGVEKRNIFVDDMDYRMFLYYIKYYLEIPNDKDIKQKNRSLRDKVFLLGFCLMPNHYHLLLKQTTKDGMTKLLRAVVTNYACYFNRRYKRVGGLFQGRYKAALINQDSYLLHVSRYIHINPLELKEVENWKGSDPLHLYPYSSYAYYLRLKSAEWLNTDSILHYFSTAQRIFLKDMVSYRSFVENYSANPKETIGNLALE